MGASNSKPEADAGNGFYNPAKHQGIAIIFNQEEFDSSSLNREGSRPDEDAIANTLSKFKLGVQIERNKSKDEVLSAMRTITSMDHLASRCIVVVIMTHGEDGGELWARDLTYNKKDIIDILIQCEELAGKPKIIIIQACRGKQASTLVRVKKTSLQTDSAMLAPPDKIVPQESELIICYSTYEGKVAYRDSVKGTIFIQTVARVLEKHGKKDDIQKIFTRVRKKVAETKDMFKQMPTTESTLTADFCLGDYFKYKNSISARKSSKKPDIVAIQKKEPSSATTNSPATSSTSRNLSSINPFEIKSNATFSTLGMGSTASALSTPTLVAKQTSGAPFETNKYETTIGLKSPINNSHQKQSSISSIGAVPKTAKPYIINSPIWNPAMDIQPRKKNSEYSFKSYSTPEGRFATNSSTSLSHSSSSSYQKQQYKSQSSNTSSKSQTTTDKYQQNNKNNWNKK